MEGGTKLALLLAGGLALGCAGLGVLIVAGGRYAREVVDSSLTQDPAEVVAIARDIGDFSLPPGYTGVLGFELSDSSLAVFSAGVRDAPLPVLGLARFPSGRAPEQLLERIGASGSDYREEARRRLPILGEPREVIRSRGSRDGQPVLREVAHFTCGGEDHLIVAIGPVDGWDQQLVDAFLLSGSSWR